MVLVLGSLLAAAAIVAGCGGAQAAKEPQTTATTQQQTSTQQRLTGTAKQVHVVARKSTAAFRRELDVACRKVKASFAEAGWSGSAINAQGSIGIASLESIRTPPKLAGPYRQLIRDLLKRHLARSYGGGNSDPKLFAAYKRKYKLYAARTRADARRIGGVPSCPWPMAAPGHSVFNPQG